MPWPLGLLAPVIAKIAGAVTIAGATATTVAATAAAAAPFLAAGAAVLTGATITKFIIDENRETRERALEEARKKASRERERQLLRKKEALDKKLNRLKEQYGENVPQEIQEEVLLESSLIRGGLEGNKVGLEAKGQRASAEADNAEAELKKLHKKSGLEK